MNKRKLLGVNNVVVLENTFMKEDVQLQRYVNVYAVDRDGTISTLRETFVNDKLYNSEETDENPFDLDFQFIENYEWEECNE